MVEESELQKIEKPVVLVVEGKDDELFFQAFLDYLQIKNIQILKINGKNNLRPKLRALKQTPGFNVVKSLGIVLDADEDARATFQSVCNALQYAKLPVPKHPSEPIDGPPSVAVMILPNGNEPGALESLCIRAVAEDPAMPCVEKYFECLRENKVDLDHNIDKAKAHAFLASRREAGKRIGEAAKAGYWPWSSQVFRPLKEFIERISALV